MAALDEDERQLRKQPDVNLPLALVGTARAPKMTIGGMAQVPRQAPLPKIKFPCRGPGEGSHTGRMRPKAKVRRLAGRVGGQRTRVRERGLLMRASQLKRVQRRATVGRALGREIQGAGDDKGTACREGQG